MGDPYLEAKLETKALICLRVTFDEWSDRRFRGKIPGTPRAGPFATGVVCSSHQVSSAQNPSRLIGNLCQSTSIKGRLQKGFEHCEKMVFNGCKILRIGDFLAFFCASL